MKKNVICFVVFWGFYASASASDTVQNIGETKINFRHVNAHEVQSILKDPQGVIAPAKILDNPNNDTSSGRSSFKARYDVAQFDLDGDGQDEIFLYRYGQAQCGSHGCELDIYKQVNGKFENVLGKQTGSVQIREENVSVLPTSTKGFHDIAIGNIWHWNGEFYEFSEAR